MNKRSFLKAIGIGIASVFSLKLVAPKGPKPCWFPSNPVQTFEVDGHKFTSQYIGSTYYWIESHQRFAIQLWQYNPMRKFYSYAPGRPTKKDTIHYHDAETPCPTKP